MKLRLTPMVVALLLAAAGAASAKNDVIPLDTPDYFVEVFGGYSHRATDQGSQQNGGQQLTIFEQTVRSWQVGGRATVPIRWGLGARVEVVGGSSRIAQGTARSELGGVDGRAEVFWRDPTKGQFGVGYGYGWATPQTPSSVQSIRVNTIPVHASVYMPDLGGGTVDWNASFTYDWLELRSAAGATKQWMYEFHGSSIWYVDRFATFEGGVRYSRLIGSQQSDQLEGVFELEILVPSGKRRFGTVALLGSVGRANQMDLPSPFGSMSRLTWQIGAEVTVHFPGVDSLLELNRAYR